MSIMSLTAKCPAVRQKRQQQQQQRRHASGIAAWTSLFVLLLQLLPKAAADAQSRLTCPCCPHCSPWRHTRRVTNEEPWIWDRRPTLASDYDVTARHTGFAVSALDGPKPLSAPPPGNTFNPFEYKDAKTQRNCPPILFEDFPAGDDFDRDHPPFGPHGDRHMHFHDHPHSHHHHPFYPFSGEFVTPKFGPFGSDSSDESDDDDTDQSGVVAKVPPHSPFVYPDDERWRPLPSASATMTTKTTTTSSRPTTKLPQILPVDRVEPVRPTATAAVAINSPQCGISVGQRIFGGVETTAGQFPWITRIAYLNTTSNRISYRCSGSMITDRHVLTAAHCVVNLVNDVKLSYVRIGDGKPTDADNSAENFQVNEIIVHPAYDRPVFANDIALLGINRQATNRNGPRSTLATICLPTVDTAQLMDSMIGTTGIVAGWSTTQDGVVTPNATVRYLRLPIVNTTECAITYAQYSENFRNPIVVAPSQLCAQGQADNDVCRGDSGGPFMDDGTSGLINSNGRFTLLGIVAFGPATCGVSNFPGVYTRVSSFISWIVQNVR